MNMPRSTAVVVVTILILFAIAYLILERSEYNNNSFFVDEIAAQYHNFLKEGKVIEIYFKSWNQLDNDKPENHSPDNLSEIIELASDAGYDVSGFENCKNDVLYSRNNLNLEKISFRVSFNELCLPTKIEIFKHSILSF